MVKKILVVVTELLVLAAPTVFPADFYSYDPGTGQHRWGRMDPDTGNFYFYDSLGKHEWGHIDRDTGRFYRYDLEGNYRWGRIDPNTGYFYEYGY